MQQTGRADFFNQNLAVYSFILGPFAAISQSIPANDVLPFSPSAYGATVVSTSTADGAVEANQTSYTLAYKSGPSDPLVTLSKSNASQTSFPLTGDCSTISLH